MFNIQLTNDLEVGYNWNNITINVYMFYWANTKTYIVLSYLNQSVHDLVPISLLLCWVLLLDLLLKPLGCYCFSIILISLPAFVSNVISDILIILCWPLLQKHTPPVTFNSFQILPFSVLCFFLFLHLY